VGVAFGATPVARRESLAWSNRPLFIVGLVQLGYRDEAIQMIIGDNVL
jgi:membrane dipeptidase